jgi:uncharacterized protein YigE (DUF2233 family)
MKNMQTFQYALLLMPWMLHAPVSAEAWKQLTSGLEAGTFAASKKSHTGDSKITVVRISPDTYKLKVLCASELDSTNRTVKEWCRDFKLTAAINAGMYAKDYSTHVGYLRNFRHVNSSRMLKNYKAVLAFNPVAQDVPAVQIIDLACQNFSALKNKYNSLVQNIRMISCEQKNVWSRQKQAYSLAALAMDKNGNVLFLFSQSPYTVHDFINIVLQLPLSIFNAMYLEGGSPAALYCKSGDFVLEKHGLYETGKENGSSLTVAQAMPNVIGIVKK